MKYFRQVRRTDPMSPSGWRDQQGLASGCLIAIALVIIIIVGGGIYVSKNYRIWAAKAVTMAMSAVISGSDLPYEEKNEIKDILDIVKDEYLAGDIQLEELGTVLEAMASCPALAIGMVVQFEASYVTDSGLSETEMEDARLQLNRFAQGLINDSINWSDLDDVTEPILAYAGDDDKTLKPPGDCSTDEIRQVLSNIKAAADQQNIPMQFVNIDISDEFLRTIEGALGRQIV